MLRIALLFSGVFLATASAVFGTTLSKEAETISIFEAVCMVNADQPYLIQSFLPTMGGTEVKKVSFETSLAPLTGPTFNALLKPLSGQAFKLKAETTEFLISVTDTGACSIYSRDAEGAPVELLFKEHVINQLLAKNVLNLQTHSTYAVTYPVEGGAIHALVFVDRANSAPGLGVRLTALADQFLRARRQKSPRWPELPGSPN